MGPQPLRIPAEFWEREAVLDALAGRDLGSLFKLLKKYHGISQGMISFATETQQGDVSRIMTGRRVAATFAVVDRVATGLRMPDSARMRLVLAPLCGISEYSHHTVTGSHVSKEKSADSTPLNENGEAYDSASDHRFDTAWSAENTVALARWFTRKDLTLNRREVAKVFVGFTVGAALLEPLEHWLMGPNSVAGFTRRADEAHIGLTEVEQIENSAAIFRNWDDRFGGGLRRKAVVGQLSELSDLLAERHSTETRQRLFLVMADLAETAAMMSWDSGSNTLAQRYYMLALRASTEAGDRTFGANILAGMARQLLYMDRAGEALEISRLALDGTPTGTNPAVRAMLHTREAWAYAKLGRVGAFRRATERAEDILADAGSNELADGPHWISYFDTAELAGVTGGRLLELAHTDSRYAGDAADYIGRAVQFRQGQHLRSKALDEVGLAEALLLRGELEEGVRLGHAAIETVEQTTSDRVQIKLAELYQYSGKHLGKTSAVADLRDRIRSTLRPDAQAS